MVCDGVSVPLAIAAASHDQTAQDARSFESSMRQHYDAAFRFQTAGDLAQAGMQYKLFLADALHELGNGRADIREYARALALYEDAIALAPADFILHLDYARAALDAGNPSKARALAQDSLDLHAKGAAPSEVAGARLPAFLPSQTSSSGLRKATCPYDPLERSRRRGSHCLGTKQPAAGAGLPAITKLRQVEAGRTKALKRIRKASTFLKAWRAYRSCWAAEAPGALVASVSGRLERVP
jgi:tetratricopeptide (TPR) repeat protein